MDTIGKVLKEFVEQWGVFILIGLVIAIAFNDSHILGWWMLGGVLNAAFHKNDK